MGFENNRRYPRTRLRAEVKLHLPEAGEQMAHTRDISDGGAFVIGVDHDLPAPAVGSIIEVQVQGMPGEPAPVVPMRVVRVDAEGIALEFLDASDDQDDPQAR